MLSDAPLVSRKASILWISFHKVENVICMFFSEVLRSKLYPVLVLGVYGNMVDLFLSTDVDHTVLCDTLQCFLFVYEQQVMNASSLC